MCGTESRAQLPLASSEQHGCSCCSPGSGKQTAAPVSGTEYALEGLTCGHCVETVEKAVSGVAGVRSASVDLVPGGTSRLTVAGTPEASALREAVRSSGYVLVGSN